MRIFLAVLRDLDLYMDSPLDLNDAELIRPTRSLIAPEFIDKFADAFFIRWRELRRLSLLSDVNILSLLMESSRSSRYFYNFFT